MWKNNNQKLSIHGIEVEASHGVYSVEKKSKNKFQIDIDVWADYSKAMKNDHLQDTLDYQLIHTIVIEEMAITSDLIENVCYRIVERVQLIDFPMQSIRVNIFKLSPPLDGFVKNTSFELISTFGNG